MNRGEKAAYQPVNGLGGLLGGGFRLRKPQGNHQGGENLGVEGTLPGTADTGEFLGFEERWTGAYIFENERQSFRTRQDRDLELKTATHIYPKAGRYVVAVKVIDIFENDTMTLVPVTAG